MYTYIYIHIFTVFVHILYRWVEGLGYFCLLFSWGAGRWGQDTNKFIKGMNHELSLKVIASTQVTSVESAVFFSGSLKVDCWWEIPALFFEEHSVILLNSKLSQNYVWQRRWSAGAENSWIFVKSTWLSEYIAFTFFFAKISRDVPFINHKTLIHPGMYESCTLLSKWRQIEHQIPIWYV